jgi:hypothetical protein
MVNLVIQNKYGPSEGKVEAVPHFGLWDNRDGELHPFLPYQLVQLCHRVLEWNLQHHPHAQY